MSSSKTEYLEVHAITRVEPGEHGSVPVKKEDRGPWRHCGQKTPWLAKGETVPFLEYIWERGHCLSWDTRADKHHCTALVISIRASAESS